MEGSLDLNQGTELWTVVFDIDTAVLISTDVGMQSRNWNIVDTNICIVPTTKTDFFSIVEVYYVELFLFLVVLLRRIYLETLNDQIIFGRFNNFKNLVHYSIVFKLIFKLRFTKLTMESFPSIAGYMWRNLFILIPAEPLP